MRLECKTCQKKKLLCASKPSHHTKLLAADQGETSTIFTFVSGVSRVIPLMVIHEGEQVQEAWTQDVPVRVHITLTSEGYITKQKFHEYGACFMEF